MIARELGLAEILVAFVGVQVLCVCTLFVWELISVWRRR